MTLIAIICANCGAKYRLPETFKSDKAKCKKCGTVIDVAAQRQSAAEASPAATAPTAAAGSAEEARPGRSSRASSTPRGGRSAGGTSRRSSSRASGRRRGQSDEPEKKGKGMLIGVGIGGLAVIVVAVVLITSGGEPAEDQTAGVDPAAQLAAEQAQAEQAAAVAAAAAARAAAEQAAAEEAAAAEAAAAEAAAEQRGRAAEATESVDRWVDYDIETVEEVFNPRTETERVPWPDYVTEEEQREIESLLDDVEGGGLAGTRAKTALEEMGHKSLAAIINRLREIDYTDSFGTMYGYELNKLIERSTLTINAAFEVVELGSAVDLRIAHWNAQTVKAWIRFIEKYKEKEDFDRLVASIKARR